MSEVTVTHDGFAQDDDVYCKVRGVGASCAGGILTTDGAGVSGNVEDLVKGGRGERGFSPMELVRDLQRGSEAIAFGHES